MTYLIFIPNIRISEFKNGYSDMSKILFGNSSVPVSVHKEIKPVCAKCCNHHLTINCDAKTVVCPKCGGGHRFADCLQSISCFHCKKAGKIWTRHYANSKDCPMRIVQQPREAPKPDKPVWEDVRETGIENTLLELMYDSPLSNLDLAGLLVKVIEKRTSFPPLNSSNSN